MRKKYADQQHSICAANQRLCFRLIDSSTTSLPSKSEISKLWLVVGHPGLWVILCYPCNAQFYKKWVRGEGGGLYYHYVSE